MTFARSVGQQLGGAAVLVDRPTPDAGYDACPGGRQRREVVGQPGGDARTLQPDRVDHADAGRMHSRRRVALPLERRQRLHDVGAEIGKIEERLELRPVPRRPRRRHHRIGQLHRPNPDPSVNVQNVRETSTRSRSASGVIEASATVIFLQGAHGEVVADVFGHSLHGGQRCLDGGHRADPMGDGGLADLLTVAASPATLTLRVLTTKAMSPPAMRLTALIP